jgi:pimeloyl-ACP methyl ester carboxylesterase
MRLNHHRRGRGEPLVLIHGIGSRWDVWEPVLSRLAAEREVVALDLPGFAASPPPPPGTPAGIASLTRLVAESIDELGLVQPHVAGNSLGGWISFELAKQGRVRSVTALSPAGFHNDIEARYQHGALWVAARAARALAPRPHRVLGSPLGRTLMLGLVIAKPAAVAPADAVRTVRGVADAVWFDETLPAVLADRFSGGDQIEVPVTIAWGEHDRLLLPHQARRAARLVPAARIVTLRGCGHVPMYDDPEQVAGVLLEGSRAAAPVAA